MAVATMGQGQRMDGRRGLHEVRGAGAWARALALVAALGAGCSDPASDGDVVATDVGVDVGAGDIGADSMDAASDVADVVGDAAGDAAGDVDADPSDTTDVEDGGGQDGSANDTDGNDIGAADAGADVDPDTGGPDTGAADTTPPDSTGTDTTGTDTTGTDTTGTDTTGTDTTAPDAGPVDTCGCSKDADCAAGPSKPCQATLCVGCQCQEVPFKDGAPCDDGKACTSDDACKAGACVASEAGCQPALPPGMGQSPCKVPGKPPAPAKAKLVPAFSNLTFAMPVELTTPGDGTNQIAVVERAGRIRVFPNDPAVATTTELLNITGKIDQKGEGGLLSAAFHPAYASNGHVYVNYTRIGDFHTIVARYTKGSNGVAPSASELVLLDIPQPYSNHNGGQLAFDNAGKLLVGMGDGGSGGDPLGSGQNAKTLLGAMLRIDVDTPSPGKTYGIPADNPNKPDWLPEIWAIGLRNPWRFSVDKPTGKVWVADVGQGKWEEVDIVQGGGNYGWNVMEGNHCYAPANCDPKPYDPPVFEYDHGQGTSITGGHVYRGKQNPSLVGAYVFADYGSGRFWSLHADGKGGWTPTVLGVLPTKPVDIGQDEQGELYAVQLFGATIQRLVEDSASIAEPAPPATLSATNCFSDLKTLTPAAGVLPYDVNAPLWSDGASKARFVVLPNASGAPAAPPKPAPLALAADDLDVATAPVGTLVIKHFALGNAAIGQPGSVPVETRFMRRDADGWVFLTYRWRADGSDADVVFAGDKVAVAFPGGGSQTWPLPSVDGCKTCHQGPSGPGLLGMSAAQLNRQGSFGSVQANQLAAWAAGGALTGYAGDPNKHAAFPPQLLLPNTTDPLSVQTHARTWLHVQCASCHRPGGSSQASIDLRFGTALAASGACNVTPAFGDLGLNNAKILAPGAAASSVLLARVQAQPGSAPFMPQLGVSIVQPQAAALLTTWLGQLSGCN